MLESIKQIINNMPKDIEILICSVVSTSPLTIQENGNSKRQIPNEFITLTRNVTNYKERLRIDGVEREIEFKNELKINDIILVMSCDEAQSFIVIDRVV